MKGSAALRPSQAIIIEKLKYTKSDLKHGFRDRISYSIGFHPYALVVGANNSGKSTIIDCIRDFYEKDGFKFKKESDFPLGLRKLRI